MRAYEPKGPARFDHQKQGLNKMIETKGVCALLFDPGTGKTGTTLDYLTVLALAGKREVRALVFAPLAAVDTWVGQSAAFVHDDVQVWAEAPGGSIVQKADVLKARARHLSAGTKRSIDLYRRGVDWPEEGTSRRLDPLAEKEPVPRIVLEVLNLDVLSNRNAVTSSRTTLDAVMEGIKDFDPDVVIIDESHRIKGQTSNVSRAAWRIGNLVPRRIILTGTVMPHSPMDVWSQWRFLDPLAFGVTGKDGVRRPASFSQFRSYFAKMGGWQGKEILGFRNLDELEKVMAQNSIVARKEDVLDLPPTTDIVVDVQLSTAEARAYRQMKEDLAHQFADGTMTAASNRLAQLMRLRQITSGYLPDSFGNPVEIGKSKVQTIKSIVNDNLAGENRIVIFCNFRHEIDQLVEIFTAKGAPKAVVEQITGDTRTKERKEIRRRFGDTDNYPDRMILVAQISTLSLAVNELVTASHAIFASLTRQRDDFVQAKARLDRQGQLRPVTFWYAIVPKTIDEVILRSHEQRTGLEDDVLRHVMGE